MNTRDSLLVALPTLLLGVGAGYQLELMLEDVPLEVEAAGPSARAPITETTRRNVEPAPLMPTSAGPTRSSAPAKSAPEAAHVSEPELARAMESVTAPAVTAAVGEGSITGTVLDEDGTPLANVVVIGYQRPGNSRAGDPADVGGAPPAERSLKEFLREQSKTWADGRARRMRATTGPDGAYVLDGLNEELSYSLNAYCEGFVVESDRRAYEVTVGQKLGFRARRVHEVPIEFVSEDGGELGDRIVSVERGNSTSQFKWSAEEPTLRLVAGRVGLTGYGGARPSSGYGNGLDSSHRSEKVSLDVIENGGAPVQLVLKARGGLRGRVQDPWDSTSSHEVKALRLPPDGILDEKALAKSNHEGRVRGSRYSILDLSPGRYAVGLKTRNSETLLAHEIVDIAGQVVEVDLTVPEPDASKNLIVRAFGPKGRPLDDVTFNFRQQRKGGSSSGGVETRRAPDGAYWISLGSRYEGFFDTWEAEMSFTLTAQHSELGNRVIELAQGQRELEVHFVEPVSIVVLVTGLEGSGQEGKVRASVQRVEEGASSEDINNYISRGRSRGRNDGALSPEGKARFDGLEPGLWRVGLMAGQDRWQSEMVASQEVRVLSGETVVTLAVPLLHSLSVHAPGLEVGAWLSLRAADKEDDNQFWNGKNGNLDKDHRVVFEGLVAGQYVLSGSGIREEQQVTVPGGEFFLDIKEPDCMRVSIGDMEGALYKAGLRAGDLIVGVDGKDLTRANAFWKMHREAKGETVALTVLRGKERLELSLPIVKMSGNWYEKLGGMLTPASRE